jgi:nicotinamidase-related amidase
LYREERGTGRKMFGRPSEVLMIFPNLTPDNSVLLVIDVINSCAHLDFEDPLRNIHYNKIRQMIPVLSNFITSYKKLGGKVILTTTVPWQESYLPENINELYRNNEEARYWSQDLSGRAELFYQIPAEGALVFAKNSYDAFTNEDLVRALEEMHKRYIIVAGIFGDGCVMASICGAFSKGYSLIIARDLIETTDDDNRQILQQQLKQRTWPLMYGETLESDQLLMLLRGERNSNS